MKTFNMKELWNKRYKSEEYVYGTDPNMFFAERISNLEPGKLLLPAEGEGRNAIYAAKLGWDVFAFDISVEGQRKANKLAKINNVDIEYKVAEITDLDLDIESFDVAALISAHFPPHLRKQYHYETGNLVRPGGLVILEGFSKNNLEIRESNPEIGGPNRIEILFSKEEIKNDFANFRVEQLEEVETELNEGSLHNGDAKVIRYIGQKL